MSQSSNIVDVNKINMLINIDLLAAAPAYPITIWYAEIGADSNSKIEPLKKIVARMGDRKILKIMDFN